MNKVKRIDLNALEVIAPCSVDWDNMQGDDKIRLCGYCEKRVFNLVSMTRAEISHLLAAEISSGNSKDVCVQMVKTTDGKLVTSDCVRAREKFALRKYASRLARWVAVILAALVSGNSLSVLAQDAALQNVFPQEKTAAGNPGFQLQNCTNGTIGPQGGDATVIQGVNTAGTVRINGGTNFEALYATASNAGRIGVAGVAVGALFLLWKRRRVDAPLTAASIGNDIKKWLILPGVCVVGLCYLWSTLLPVEQLPIPFPILQFLLQKSEITLAQERTMSGITFPAGSEVSCGSLGTLKQAQLNSPAVIHNIAFPANTWIEFYELNPGQLGSVSTHNKVSFGKANLSGKNIHMSFVGYTSVVDYAEASDGSLRVNDLYFRQGQSVSFYHDGTVQSGSLAKEAIVNRVTIGPSPGKEYDKSVEFYANGELKFGYLPKRETIDGLILEAGYPVYFFANGKLQGGTLADRQTIKGIDCTGQFRLFDHGNPHEIHLATDQKVRGEQYKAGDKLFLSNSGEVTGWAGGSN